MRALVAGYLVMGALWFCWAYARGSWLLGIVAGAFIVAALTVPLIARGAARMLGDEEW